MEEALFQGQEGTHQASVQVVGVFKPEYFDTDDPDNWFVSFEANLRIHNVPKEGEIRLPPLRAQ